VVVEAKRGTIDGVMWVWAVVIVALTGAVVAVAVGRGGSMSEVFDDRPDAALPSGRPLTSDDLRDVRFSTAVRGYRMDEVDALLARLRADMIARESIPPDEDVRVFNGLAESAAVSVTTEAESAPDELSGSEPRADHTGRDPVDPTPTIGRRVRDHGDAPTSEREPM
jgi:DivIVA domain-containing protein